MMRKIWDVLTEVRGPDDISLINQLGLLIFIVILGTTIP